MDLIETLDIELSGQENRSPIKSHIEGTDLGRRDELYLKWIDEYLRKINQSEISKLLSTHTVEVLTCLSCSKSKFSFSYSISLPLEISTRVKREGNCTSYLTSALKSVISPYATDSTINEEEFSIEDLLKQNFKEETIEGFRCQFCKQSVSVKKEQSVMKYPDILLLSIKRFDQSMGYIRKLDSRVKFNELLIFPDFNGDQSTFACYSLISLVNHFGTLNSGHYTA